MGLKEVAELYRNAREIQAAEIEHLKRKLNDAERNLSLMREQLRGAQRDRLLFYERCAKAERANKQLNERIFQLKQKERDLAGLAYYDRQTGLPNRQVFNREIEMRLDQLKRADSACLMGILFVGLDQRFAKIRQTLGYTVADTLLFKSAARIKKTLETFDYQLYQSDRIDEFIVVLPETGLSTACTIAEKARRMVEQHDFEFAGTKIPLTISLGASELSPMAADPMNFIRAADDKLYEAKGSGRNCVAG